MVDSPARRIVAGSLVVDQPDLRFAQRRLDDTGANEGLRIVRPFPTRLRRKRIESFCTDLSRICAMNLLDSVLFTQNMQGHRYEVWLSIEEVVEGVTPGMDLAYHPVEIRQISRCWSWRAPGKCRGYWPGRSSSFPRSSSDRFSRVAGVRSSSSFLT